MRILPELTPENRAFWTGGAEGRLMIARCPACRRAIHPPQLVCPACLTDGVEAEPVSGAGVIHSFTVNRQAWGGLEVPFALAIVELEDAPEVRITARLVDVDVDALAIGDRVEVVFEADRGVWLPRFRPRSS